MSVLQPGLLGLAFGSAAFVVAHIIMTRLGVVKAEPVDAHPPLWPALMTLGVFAAIEELVFRLGMIGYGARLVGFPAAFIVSVALFAVVHRTEERLTPLAWANLVLVGAVLGLLYHDRGFFAALGFHWAWNAWEWVLGYAVSGEKNRSRLPAPPVTRRIGRLAYGPEAHWASGASLLASLIGLLLLRP